MLVSSLLCICALLLSGLSTAFSAAATTNPVQVEQQQVVLAAPRSNSVWINPRRVGLYARQYASLARAGYPNSAVFAACSLAAGGITHIFGLSACTVDSPDTLNNSITIWNQIVRSFPNELESGWSLVELSDFVSLREGDLIFFVSDVSSGTDPCLGGVIGPTDTADLSVPIVTDHRQLNFYLHSYSVNGTVDYSFPLQSIEGVGFPCLAGSTTPRYVRIQSDQAAPTISIPDSYQLNDTGAALPISWNSTDSESGVYTSTLQIFNGSTWVDQVADLEATQTNLELPLCSTTRMRVASSDQAGNIGFSSETVVRVYQQGDFDQDGNILENDLAQLERWIIGIENPWPAHADLTGDSSVTMDDYLWLTLRLGESCAF
jgi:hypothetical protein